MENYIVLDLEWNQSPEGKEAAVDHFPFEIIEIGAVRLNNLMEETGSFHRLIKPKVYPEIHEIIAQVTHIDAEKLVNEGKDFEVVIEEFLEWCGRDPVYCTWGSMDLTELQRNMAYYSIPIPFEKTLLYYDIQKLYCLLYGDGKTKPSLDVAVEQLDLREDMPFHQALADAHYTGRIMAHMDFNAVRKYWSTDYYQLPETKEEEVYLVFPTYSKYISRTFESKEEAIADKTVADLICYHCNRMLRKKVRWFSVNQKFYFALGYCPVHGYIKGKIRMKRSDDGRIYAVKTLKLISDEEAQKIYEKKEDAKLKRVEKMKIRKKQKRSNNSKI